jgi:hypothetical protein
LVLVGISPQQSVAQMMRVQTRTPLITPVTTTPVQAAAPAARSTPLSVPSVGNQAINPNFFIAPGLSLPQATFNTAAFGQALSQVPPYAFGFNTYLQGANINPLLSSAGIANGSLAASGLNGTGSLGNGTSSLGAGIYGGGGYGGLSNSPYGSGYGGGGTGSSYGGYQEDPYAGYLRGAAGLTTATGNLLNQVQQARLVQTQADTAKVDLRRRVAEEAAAARKQWLNPDAERVRDVQNAYIRATRDPPAADVLSGRALNDLYAHAAPIRDRIRIQGNSDRDVPLDANLIRQVNWTGTGSSASLGLLKDRGRLNWPIVFHSGEFDSARNEFSLLAVDVMRQHQFNAAPASALLHDMTADVGVLKQTLQRKVSELTPADYIEARRYLAGLESAVKALQDPNVATQSTARLHTPPENVAALIDWMNQQGLRFGPATAGDEPAYRHVYQRLLAYDATISEQSARQ